MYFTEEPVADSQQIFAAETQAVFSHGQQSDEGIISYFYNMLDLIYYCIPAPFFCYIVIMTQRLFFTY